MGDFFIRLKWDNFFGINAQISWVGSTDTGVVSGSVRGMLSCFNA